MKTYCTVPVRHSGFTLIEMMVVLVIIGIIVSSVVLSIKTGDIDEYMETEMRRVQALLNLARDEAVLQGQEIALVVEENRYQFEVMVEGAWQPIEGDRVFRQREVLTGTELALVVDDLEINLGGSQQQDEPGGDDDVEAEKKNRPRIYILSSGEIMPFELILRTEDQSIEYRVKVEENSKPVLLYPQELG